MIDPTDVINFNRTQEELEEFVLFTAVVAGKKASNQVKALDRFLSYLPHKSPFEAIRQMDSRKVLLNNIINSRLGQYTHLHRCFRELVHSKIDLKTCTVEELERVHKIGFKTSRFFVVPNRPEQKYAILDTHILAFMRDHLGISHAPRQTPSNLKVYQHYEHIFVKYAQELETPVAVLDLDLWNIYSSRKLDLVNRYPREIKDAAYSNVITAGIGSFTHLRG